MREEMIVAILNDLNGSSTDIEASAVISTDGLMIASVLPAGLDEDRVGAMTAAMLSSDAVIRSSSSRDGMRRTLSRTAVLKFADAGRDSGHASGKTRDCFWAIRRAAHRIGSFCKRTSNSLRSTSTISPSTNAATTTMTAQRSFKARSSK